MDGVFSAAAVWIGRVCCRQRGYEGGAGSFIPFTKLDFTNDLLCRKRNGKFANIWRLANSRRLSAKEVMSIPFPDIIDVGSPIRKRNAHYFFSRQSPRICQEPNNRIWHNIHYHFRHQYHISPVGCCQQYKATTFSTSQITRISRIPSALIFLQQTNLCCFSFPNISTILSLDARELKPGDKEQFTIVTCSYHIVRLIWFSAE